MVQLEIGGQVRKLCFTKFGYQKFLHDVQKVRTNGQEESEFETISNMIYAGLMCQHYIDGADPDFTKEDVDKWLMHVETEALTALIAQINASKGESVGEAQALPLPGTS